ncbi:hypothetical protein Vadar_014907 [Vaccinium darrowii]|uniref:Uncharacterized protein n=1 Tax=Vaccinium darrowii TaxID=229202 RepID=A0ACB7Z459_9ERIC|nr:hypothetical protein Vadar_014907 [Vaccinium darrowii]
MASTSLALPSQQLQFPSQGSTNLPPKPFFSTHRLIIRAVVPSEKPSRPVNAEKPTNLPIRKIPATMASLSSDHSKTGKSTSTTKAETNPEIRIDGFQANMPPV